MRQLSLPLPEIRLPEIPALTGLRAFAALWVLLFHLWPQIRLFFGELGYVGIFASGGYYGVDLFFVLSGFIIGYNYFDRLNEFHWHGYRNFIFARLARLYPLHLLTLISTWLAITVARRVFDFPVIGHFTTHEFWAHVFLISAWDFPAKLSWNHFAWSVSAEFLAYLLAPVFVALVTWMRRPLWHIAFATLLCMICPLLDYATPYAATGYAIPRVLCGFGLGMIAYYRLYRHKVTFIRLHGLIYLLLPVMLGVMYGEYLLDYKTRFFVLPLFALLIATLALSKNKITQLLSRPVVQYLGRISYAIYITQFVVLMPIRKLWPPEHLFFLSWQTKLCYLLAEISVVLLVAVASYHLAEKPARRFLKERLISD